MDQLFSVSERTYSDAPHTERHPFLQLVLPVRGRLEMEIAGAPGYAGDAQFAQVPVGVEHRYWADRPNRLLILDLAPALVADGQEHAGQFRSSLDVPFRTIDERMALFASLVSVELARGGMVEPLVAESLGRYACSLLVESLSGQRPDTSPGERRLALRTRDYLDTAYLAPLSIAEVAAAVSASASHVQRTFRAHVGTSIVSYVQTRRLRHARTLLQTTDLSIAEIAFASGFSSQSYFTRLFTREMGTTPTRFRAQNRASARSDK